MLPSRKKPGPAPKCTCGLCKLCKMCIRGVRYYHRSKAREIANLKRIRESGQYEELPPDVR